MCFPGAHVSSGFGVMQKSNAGRRVRLLSAPAPLVPPKPLEILGAHAFPLGLASWPVMFPQCEGERKGWTWVMWICSHQNQTETVRFFIITAQSALAPGSGGAVGCHMVTAMAEVTPSDLNSPGLPAALGHS